VDTFVVYIDHETWAGDVPPAQALRAYRDARGIPAKLIVVGMTSTGFSIADPNDAGMRDVVGLTRRRCRSSPTLLARSALRSSSEGAALTTAAGVATHRHLGSQLTRKSSRLLTGRCWFESNRSRFMSTTYRFVRPAVEALHAPKLVRLQPGPSRAWSRRYGILLPREQHTRGFHSRAYDIWV
jgi:hypothetical protein